ncbi:MAG TPA: hypothetical protein VIE64_04505 [Solirubrobacterales bacterium]|jgi:hypothetical protein
MSEAVVLVTRVGAATGSKAAAAALACAASEPDRAGLLIDLTDARPPRPSLIATGAARELEERLAVHLPNGGVASRGQTCHLALHTDTSVDDVAGALPLARESVAVVHLPPHLLQPILDQAPFSPSAALLRADLPEDRALTALAARDLAQRSIRVVVLKQPLGWVASRRALAGVLPVGSGGGLSERLLGRVLEERWRAQGATMPVGGGGHRIV